MRPHEEAAAREPAELVRVRDAGYKALFEGKLEEARDLLMQVVGMARLATDVDPDSVDKALVDLALVHVQRHEDRLAEDGLREVLLRSTNDEVVRVAAHCLAKVLAHGHQHDKAQRFARLSLEKARKSEDPDRIHAALSLMGAILGGQSHLTEALNYYEQAFAVLEAHPPSNPRECAYFRCWALDAIGYTLIMTGRLAEGRQRLEEAADLAREHDVTDARAEIAADLAFALLRLGELELGILQAKTSLELAEANGYTHLRRNCYYLLGELASRAGDAQEAEAWFDRLAEFYPRLPFLTQFLSTYDISEFINLKEFA